MASENLVKINSKTNKKLTATKNVFIKTFGCQMNVYDSLKLEKILENDYNKVETIEDADLVLINTCSVRDKPEKKLYSYIGKVKKIKRGSDIMIGVGGCVAQQEGQNIINRSSDVDFVFGTHNLSLVPSLISLRENGAPAQVAVDYRDDWEELPLGISDYGRVSSFVSISRGCNKVCAYCVVPNTRGKEVSRAIDEILKEVRIAAHRGAREVLLLGQTVNSYGLDFNPRIKFVSLLDEVSKVKGIERIRFTSPHPQEVRPDFYDLLIDNPKVCRSIHMPLQSGNDRILKLMNRNYKKKTYLNIINKLRQRVPDVTITTDFIVGFPTETEEEFVESLEIIKEVGFASSFSYMYSPRPGTPAENMDDMDQSIKLERLQRLQAVQEEVTQNCLDEWIGKEVEVLIDSPSAVDPRKMQGRTSQNFIVNLNNFYQDLEPGKFINCLITGKSKFTLKGDMKQILEK